MVFVPVTIEDGKGLFYQKDIVYARHSLHKHLTPFIISIDQL